MDQSKILFDVNHNQVAIVIPSLHPDEKLLNLVHELRIHFGAEQMIVIVDDGSQAAYASYFRESEEKYQCKVLTHAVNLGKGRALKTAFNYLLNLDLEIKGVVTIDSDGQHALKDIEQCMKTLVEKQDRIVFGCRSFEQSNVPAKNKFGNKLTRRLLRLLTGIQLSDTQTGLRAIPKQYLQLLLNVPGERFEYEMNMILAFKDHNINITEVPIQTIYIDENKSSHFNPIVDSIRIYAVFGKYVLSAGLSFIIDLFCFRLFLSFFSYISSSFYIIGATIAARIISSLFNYYSNQKLVFKNHNQKSLLRYYSLAAVQMLVSAFLVNLLYRQFQVLGETTWKIIVDSILFFVSFQIQRNWVFIKE